MTGNLDGYGQLPDDLLNTAARFGLDVAALDTHVESIHGVERHDGDYPYALVESAVCLTVNLCTQPGCTCTSHKHPHAVDCLMTAWQQAPNRAMVNRRGEVFYPDSPADAARFAADHAARFLVFAADDRWGTTGGDVLTAAGGGLS